MLTKKTLWYLDRLEEVSDSLHYALTNNHTYERLNRDRDGNPVSSTLQDHKANSEGIAINFHRLKKPTNVVKAILWRKAST